MKKYIMLFMLLCLTGCGTAKPADGTILYNLEDTRAQKRLLTQYREKLETNAEDTVKNMDDITDDIFEYCGTRKVYSDKEHPELMVYYSEKIKNNNHSGYGLSYEVLNTAKEYRPFIDGICAQTGLLYSCTMLGGKYADESDISDLLVKEYTGRNIISFSNPAFRLLSGGAAAKADLLNIIPAKKDEKLRYKDLPMRVNFYLYKDKIKYVNIFLLTDEQNKVPTQNNLKQLSFESVAAELVNSINTQSDYVKGTKNGVKYTIQKDIDNTPEGMKINVISLEY